MQCTTLVASLLPQLLLPPCGGLSTATSARAAERRALHEKPPAPAAAIFTECDCTLYKSLGSGKHLTGVTSGAPVWGLKADDEQIAAHYDITARRSSSGPFFRGGAKSAQSIFLFNYNPSSLPLPDGGEALAVRAQCGGLPGCAWGADVSVVALSRRTALSPLAFAPITNSSVILAPAVFSGMNDESCGVEDPRVTFDPASKIYYMTYTCWGCHTYNLCMATCAGDPSDLGCWRRQGRLFRDNNTKSGSLLVMPKPPHWMIYGCFPVRVAKTVDFKTWTQLEKPLLPQRPGRWDSGMETGPMPMKISDGNYLFIFNGVSWNVSSCCHHCHRTQPWLPRLLRQVSVPQGKPAALHSPR